MKIRDRIRELRRVKASELRPNPKNWRTHPKQQQDALRGVLSEIGYADALIARELSDGSLELIDGHLRAETTPDQEVPVLVLDVTEKEAGKILATLDPLSAMAEADADQLEKLMQELDGEIESDAVKGMLDDLAKESGVGEGKEIVEDEVPEPPKVPVTKPGDLWIMGEHRLLCGDSTKADDVARLLIDCRPFLMVTDPPYGVEYDPTWRDGVGTFNDKTKMRGLVCNDGVIDWTTAYALFPGDVAYVWHAGKYCGTVAANLESVKFDIRSQIVWKKHHFAMSRGDYHWHHEPCWYAVRRGNVSRWCGDRTQSTIWEIDSLNPGGRGKIQDGDEKTNHSTQKPIECMARPIRNHGGKGDDVYDPFLGSGTTLIAAEQLSRRCFGMEISPAYCDVIVNRWEKLTGKKAKLDTSKKKGGSQ